MRGTRLQNDSLRHHARSATATISRPQAKRRAPPLALGVGILELQYTDDPQLRGNYSIFVQIEELSGGTAEPASTRSEGLLIYNAATGGAGFFSTDGAGGAVGLNPLRSYTDRTASDHIDKGLFSGLARASCCRLAGGGSPHVFSPARRTTR